MARGWGRVAASLGGSLLAVLSVTAGIGPGAPTPAGAHARLVGSAPDDGSTVRAAPDEVSIVLDSKPATVEGDPLQVYDPDGRRVDEADARADGRGRTLTVGLDHSRELPAGEYQVAYRVVSADSHVIAGRLSFSTRSAAAGGGAGSEVGTVWTPSGESAAVDAPASPDSRLRRDGPGDARPRLVAAGAAILAVLVLALRVLRWAAPDPARPARVPSRWADPPSDSSGIRHHPSGSGWDRPRGGSRSRYRSGVGPGSPGRGRSGDAGRRQRVGRRSSPVSAGLRLPAPGADRSGARPTASTQDPPVPAIVTGTHPRPWTTTSPHRPPTNHPPDTAYLPTSADYLSPAGRTSTPSPTRHLPETDYTDYPTPTTNRPHAATEYPTPAHTHTAPDARRPPSSWNTSTPGPTRYLPDMDDSALTARAEYLPPAGRTWPGSSMPGWDGRIGEGGRSGTASDRSAAGWNRSVRSGNRLAAGSPRSRPGPRGSEGGGRRAALQSRTVAEARGLPAPGRRRPPEDPAWS